MIPSDFASRKGLALGLAVDMGLAVVTMGLVIGCVAYIARGAVLRALCVVIAGYAEYAA